MAKINQNSVSEDLNEIVSNQYSKRKLVYENFDEALNLAVNGSKTITLKPPKNEIWVLKNLAARMPIPAGGASGSHRIEIMYHSDIAYNRVLYVAGNWNVEMYIVSNYAKTGTAEPADVSAQVLNLKDLVITHDVPVLIKYMNLTNVANNNTFFCRVTKEVITL